MATKLHNGGGNGQTAQQILADKGRSLVSGYMDEFDREAEAQANAISRVRGLAPRKVGARKAGFGRPAYHPNRSPFAM